jgi:hypothetical protein
MHPAAACRRAVLGIVGVLIYSATASAQTSGYIAGAVFADVKQFTHVETTPSDGFLSATNNSATTAGGDVRIGTWIHPNVTLEIGAGASARTTVPGTDGPSALVFASIGGISIPRPQFDLKSTTQFTTVTVALGFHPTSTGRVRLGYLAGYALVRETSTSEFVELEEIPPTFSRLPSYIKAKRTIKQNSGAFMIGAEAAITLTSNLALAPEVRVLSFGGVFLIRPGVGVRWKF